MSRAESAFMGLSPEVSAQGELLTSMGKINVLTLAL